MIQQNQQEDLLHLQIWEVLLLQLIIMLHNIIQIQIQKLNHQD